MRRFRMPRVAVICCGLAISATIAAAGTSYFKIKVIDEQTGRGVPLVELKTVNNIRCFTDSNGLVAFNEPGLMGQPVFFYVSSHGYELPKDGFGYAGLTLQAVPGGSAEIKIKRINIAERLYRITGGGIYAESILLGEKTPLMQPVLNGKVLGQDSALAVPYRSGIRWFWGDTLRPRYPLGQFHMSGATAELPGRRGLDPSVGIDLTYFVDEEGFSKQMAPMDRQDMLWIDGLLTLADEGGAERMLGHYARMKSLENMVAHGLALYSDRSDTFDKLAEFDLKQQWQCPRGHPIRVKDGGQECFYFPTPYATVRVPADLKRLKDPASYEAFTCLVAGTRYDKAAENVDRDATGKVVYGWKRDTDPLSPQQESELIESGKLQPHEAFFQLKDADSGKLVIAHSGSINWNEYRKKYILIAVQFGGSSSLLGEVWFAEADAPQGPWMLGRKIVTHDRYTFYNPVHHAFLDRDGGRIIYFEGTYASTFSGNPDQTPRYDYNQIMYRLDLSDARLKAPLKPTTATAPGKKE